MKGRYISMTNSLFKINQLIAFVNLQLSSLDVYCFTSMVSNFNIYTLKIDFDFSLKSLMESLIMMMQTKDSNTMQQSSEAVTRRVNATFFQINLCTKL